jgi:uncharacterized membrane protein
MDPMITEMMQSLFRWAHVVVGVLWIGLLYFFNWVNGPFAATLDAETKQKALPELLPRALYFFRWGAAFTWITGLLLLGLVFYMGKIMVDGGDPDANRTAMMIGLAVMFVGAGLYDVMWKVLQDKEEMAVGISFVVLCGIMYYLSEMAGFSNRALYIHIGAMFGTAMAMNVWMRIWPAQRKIIGAIKAGEAPDGAWGAMAGLRSKHNTYMSLPLIFMMLNAHDTAFFDHGWIGLAGATALGWAICFWVYKKSKTAVCAEY